MTTDVALDAEYGMSVTLEFGSVVTVSTTRTGILRCFSAIKPQAIEVADERLQEALRALDSKREMMDILEIGTKHLSLLSQVGEALAEVSLTE